MPFIDPDHYVACMRLIEWAIPLALKTLQHGGISAEEQCEFWGAVRKFDFVDTDEEHTGTIAGSFIRQLDEFEAALIAEREEVTHGN